MLGRRPRFLPVGRGDEADRRALPQIPPERFHETIKAFGAYEGKAYDLLMYVITTRSTTAARATSICAR